MNFVPKTTKELAEMDLAPAGIYPFEVMSAEESVSKKGNPMIKVKLNVFVGERERHVYDYLMEAMAFKLRHFCEQVGIIDQYDAGKINASTLKGKTGFVKIAIEPATDEYDAKNVVKDYCAQKVDKEQEAIRQEEAKRGPLGKQGDDIPF